MFRGIRMLLNNRGEVGTETVVERDADEVAAEAYKEQDAENGLSQDANISPTPKKDGEKEGQPDGKSDEQGEVTKEDGEGEDANNDKAEKKPEPAKDGEGDKGSEDFDKRITEHATKHGMTYVEAKEDIEKTEEIIKQYKNDPAEMARAMRNKDREYQKLRTESDKEKAKRDPVFKRMSDDAFREYAREEIRKKADFVDAYREKYPAKSESMTDEAIIEEIAEQELFIYRRKADEKEGELKSTAARKRDDLIKGLAPENRQFIPEIKALLLETDDGAILNPDFDLSDSINWAKGKKYDADVKAAYERGLKQGKEKPEIIGAKGSGGSSVKPAGQGSDLNKAQKDRAREMFGSDYPEEKCFEMFKDAYKEELKKNRNFDPYKD